MFFFNNRTNERFPYKFVENKKDIFGKMKQDISCDILGSNSGSYEDFCLVEYNSVCPVESHSLRRLITTVHPCSYSRPSICICIITRTYISSLSTHISIIIAIIAIIIIIIILMELNYSELIHHFLGHRFLFSA